MMHSLLLQEYNVQEIKVQSHVDFLVNKIGHNLPYIFQDEY